MHQNLLSLFNLWTDKTIHVNLCKKCTIDLKKNNLYSGHCGALLTIATHILGLRAKLHKESALEAMARRPARLSVYYLSILILHQPEKYESENNNKKHQNKL